MFLDICGTYALDVLDVVYDVTFCFISPVREMKQNVTS